MLLAYFMHYMYAINSNIRKYFLARLGIDVAFRAGERLYLAEGGATSYKFNEMQIRTLCQKSGLKVVKYWANDKSAAVLLKTRLKV